jgi:hypothetical protein
MQFPVRLPLQFDLLRVDEGYIPEAANNANLEAFLHYDHTTVGFQMIISSEHSFKDKGLYILPIELDSSRTCRTFPSSPSYLYSYLPKKQECTVTMDHTPKNDHFLIIEVPDGEPPSLRCPDVFNPVSDDLASSNENIAVNNNAEDDESLDSVNKMIVDS